MGSPTATMDSMALITQVRGIRKNINDSTTMGMLQAKTARLRKSACLAMAEMTGESSLLKMMATE